MYRIISGSSSSTLWMILLSDDNESGTFPLLLLYNACGKKYIYIIYIPIDLHILIVKFLLNLPGFQPLLVETLNEKLSNQKQN